MVLGEAVGVVHAAGRVPMGGGGPQTSTETLPNGSWHSSTPERARRHGGGWRAEHACIARSPALGGVFLQRVFFDGNIVASCTDDISCSLDVFAHARLVLDCPTPVFSLLIVLRSCVA
ncbi:unnamed protein product [Prorocentrum cordatum]|uniref:Uncharacterized protein n=1 Tax=Prorocentrum cordatum TaxID=2364126 RepID=A0ABN9T9Z8_9DINO|nr:unnamed protein product [Polarella glacialis]